MKNEPLFVVSYIYDDQYFNVAVFEARVAMELACNLNAREDVVGVQINFKKPTPASVQTE